MTAFTSANVAALYRYPVKSFAAERMSEAQLTPGASLPGDRIFGLKSTRPRDDGSPGDELLFLKVIRSAPLAGLSCSYSADEGALTVSRDGSLELAVDLRTPAGRSALAEFVRTRLTSPAGEAYPYGVEVVDMTEGNRSAGRDSYIHIVTMDTARALEDEFAAAVDPLRFRPNVIVEGAPAWSELDLLGRTLRLGSAEVHVFERTARCPATTCDPKTGQSDLQIPAHLRKTLGHTDFGIYARVVRPGRVATGDRLVLD